MEDIEFHFLAPFGTSQFPRLKRLKLVNVWRWDSLLNSSQFNSVQELEFYGDAHLDLEIGNRLFPNLKRLECQGDWDEFEYILSYMTRLEELELECTYMGDPEDMDSLLVGIPDLLYRRTMDKKLRKYRNIHPRPSLLSMAGKIQHFNLI
jgi:hypothetical protein